MLPDALLRLHPSTPEVGPSSRRLGDPEPESGEPDGGFRKVRNPAPCPVPLESLSGPCLVREAGLTPPLPVPTAVYGAAQ